MSLYAGMTMDASGWLDPKLAALAGKTALRWMYGTNHPDATGPEYWRKEIADPAHRPGVALDEWVPSKNPDMEGWVAEGLRQGRKAAPDQFIAVWVTDPTPSLAKLVTDGTVDLVIAETYTPRCGSLWAGFLFALGHSAPPHGLGPELGHGR